MMIKKKCDTLIPNSFIYVINTLKRRKLAMIGSMSFNQTVSDLGTLNGMDKVEGEAQSRTMLRDVSVARIIAQLINESIH